MIQLREKFKKHHSVIFVGCLAMAAAFLMLFLTAQPSTRWMEELTVEDVSSIEIVTYAPDSTHIAKQPTQEEKTAVVTLCNAFYGTETQWDAFSNEEQLRVTIRSTGVLTYTLILYVKEATEQVALQVDEQYFLLDTDQTVAWLGLVETLRQEEIPPTTTISPLEDSLTTAEITPPEMTEVKKVIYTQMVDLTHDGIDDVIETSVSCLPEVQSEPLEVLLKMTLPCDIVVYDTTRSTNKPIYQQNYGAPHTANGQLSLVEIDGLSYLLEGSLYAGQGYYTFAHSLFSLDSQGNRQVKAEDRAEGQLSDGDAASKIDTYFSNLIPWVESATATAIAILDINLENQMVSTEDKTYLAKDYYEAVGGYYSEMADEYALLGDPQHLTPNELAYFNDTYFNGATGQNLNLANQFLHNSFDLPINIDLHSLFYLGAGADYAMDDLGGEYDAVAQAYGFDSWANIPTDVTPIPKASMDYMLEQYTGIDLFATNKIGLDQFKYLEEYDCYYNLHGDTNYYGDVEFVSGTQMGDRIVLSYYNSWKQEDYVLTLVNYGNENYKIYSNLPA